MRSDWFLQAEMVGKIKAADKQDIHDTLVIARTDAVAAEGMDRAIERALLYREAGADMLFVEAPKTKTELGRIPAALSGVPVMAGVWLKAAKRRRLRPPIEDMGFALVIFPGGIVRALAHGE